ncbi:hypothetical protein [Streptomyces sp. AP-93]|uniref:hypothetical protein n=1 Tax=Streptomyces sp. AP-93 TaxID=2929048 RepID=UPI001FAF6EBB|nr:hypothetical protein [Streptomyces sp. AP-93]MCJ0875630.1 hypothetical protein [Streptomyces sp. AP-93]
MPPCYYSETDEHGALIIYHGTGDIDFEATTELASQDGPDDQDRDDDAGPLLEGQDADLADRRAPHSRGACRDREPPPACRPCPIAHASGPRSM